MTNRPQGNWRFCSTYSVKNAYQKSNIFTQDGFIRSQFSFPFCPCYVWVDCGSWSTWNIVWGLCRCSAFVDSGHGCLFLVFRNLFFLSNNGILFTHQLPQFTYVYLITTKMCNSSINSFDLNRLWHCHMYLMGMMCLGMLEGKHNPTPSNSVHLDLCYFAAETK